MSSNLETQFAPPERTPQDILLAQISAIKEHNDLTRVLDAIPEYVMILNKEREIVFANKSLLEYLQVEDEFLSKGFRPGEAINCQHAFESEAGCGTTE
ncbi:MAG: histidine kinase, partial [Chlorobiota bacterium]